MGVKKRLMEEQRRRRCVPEINTNRRWAGSHRQQVNLSKEQEKPGGSEG